MLGGFTLVSWWTLGRSGDIGEHRKGYFEVQACIFIDFFVDLGTPFWEYFDHLGPTNVLFVMLVSRLPFLMVLWVWIWTSRIGKLSILVRMYCKNQLSQKLPFSWFQSPFFMIFGGLGTNFHVDLRIFGTHQTCHLACLVASLSGLWGAPGTLGSTRKGHFEVQAVIRSDVLWI